MYQQLISPTTLPGLLPTHDFLEVIGGFDFKELFRFEKHHFRQLLVLLELPQHVEISRYETAVSNLFLLQATYGGRRGKGLAARQELSGAHHNNNHGIFVKK